jgi:putative ABC transport system ATP-binding protein
MVSKPTPHPLVAHELERVFSTPSGPVEAVRRVNHRFIPGQVTAVMGPSGSGKSTLLNLLAGFDDPTGGRVSYGDTVISNLPERERAAFRLTTFGFVFQAANLISVLPAAKNIEFPMGLAGVSRQARKKHAMELLERFGVSHRATALPRTLSGGERQRVAIARALANDPSVVFADEPTGSLDRESGKTVVDALRSVAEDGRAVIMVTHDPEVADAADEIVRIVDGVMDDPDVTK